VTSALDVRIALKAAQLGIPLAPPQAASIARYLQLLARWNERMNLTALPLAEFPDPTLDRLVMEPLVAAPLVPDDTVVWLDIGSGGGSPALPLKIVLPHLRLTMVESSQRKAAFLREAVRTLILQDARVLAQRVETLPEDAAADLVTLRAVGVAVLRERLEQLVRRGGRLIHFHAINSETIDWKELVEIRRVGLPSERSVLTLWSRSRPANVPRGTC
jgi:16S rRNA (guanine527-N7)-methyltransferase